MLDFTFDVKVINAVTQMFGKIRVVLRATPADVPQQVALLQYWSRVCPIPVQHDCRAMLAQFDRALLQLFAGAQSFSALCLF